MGDWFEEEWWEIHTQERIAAMQCANWRLEIHQHFTCLEAYADAGIEEMEKYLHGA